jgi:hypothetical protein
MAGSWIKGETPVIDAQRLNGKQRHPGECVAIHRNDVFQLEYHHRP